MTDLGVQLFFDEPEASVAFSRELKKIDDKAMDFHVATLDPKLNMDAETLILILKIGGPALSAIGGFLTMAQAILKLIKKPAVRIEIDGKSIELSATASEEDIKALCGVVIRSEK